MTQPKQTPKPPGHSVKIDDDIYNAVADRAAAMLGFQPKPGRLINYMLREYMFPAKTSQQIADAHKAKRKQKAVEFRRLSPGEVVAPGDEFTAIKGDTIHMPRSDKQGSGGWISVVQPPYSVPGAGDIGYTVQLSDIEAGHKYRRPLAEPKRKDAK